MPAYDNDEYGFDAYGMFREPIVKSHIIDYFPEVFPRFKDDGSISNFGHYVNAHEEEVRKFDADLSYVKKSRQIDNATERDLDRIGAKYGELGKRRDRDDDEYSTYLKGVVQSFKGRGTKPGLKYAISSAINTDVDNIIIEEDFDNNQYDIRIEDTEVGFLSSVVNDVAELADPTGVKLASPPVVTLEGADISIEASESRLIESTSGLGSDGVTLDGNWKLQ